MSRRLRGISQTNHSDVIAAAIQEMPVVNSHEHCWRSFSHKYGQEYDLAYFLYWDYFDVELAIETERRILYANALEFWRIPEAVVVR